MTYLGTFDIPADRLTTYPGNPRQGDVDAIRASVRAHGQYRALVVRATDPADPAQGGTVLAGNHTLAAILAEHDDTAHHRDIPPTVRVEMHDVSDDTAAKIVAVDNRTGDRGGYDDRLLAELLSGLDDLDGTGYDLDDLAALEKSLAPPDLDDLAEEIGEPGEGDGWPSITIRVPHTVKAAWNSHLSTHDDEVAAFAALLGVEV